MALFQAALPGPRLFPPCVPLSLEHRVACIQAAEGQRRALGEAYYRPAQKQSTVLSHVALRSQSLSQRTREWNFRNSYHPYHLWLCFRS